MLLPSDLAASELFALIKKGALPHPTSSVFDRQPWIEAMEGLAEKTPRDYALATSALHYGGEIMSLRHSQAAKLVEGLRRSSGLRLLAAVANQQYLTLMDKMKEATKANRGKRPVHFEQLDQAPIKNVGGQSMTGDDHATHLVDTLPHWLHHIAALPDDGTYGTPAQPEQFAGRAMMVSSIERALRDLWQEALWAGHWLQRIEGVTVHSPADVNTAERWFAWELRQQSLLSQEMYLDLGAHIIAEGKLAPAAAALKRTVIKIFRAGKGPRRFKLGVVSGRRPSDRVRASEHDALERLYTGLFLDEPLPKLAPANITCRLLNQAWWLICDLVRLLGDVAGQAWFEDDRGVGKFAFSIGRDELQRLVGEALEIESDRATAIVGFLTIDPTDTKWLFGRGFWPTPLLPDDACGRIYLIAAPLLIGSPLRRVEAWLEKGGLTDRAGIKGRGKPFEDHVRRKIAGALANNKLLNDHRVAPHAIKRTGNSEEIDLLVRIGKTLLVGEVKCFVFPSEPLERYNYLKSVEGAAQQAKAKAAWIHQNRETVGALVGVADPAAAQALDVVPLVVTNHGFGLGLTIDGVTITDLHYLNLLMESGHYQGDARFEKGVGMLYQDVALYLDQADFEARVDELFANPPPLKRYEGKIGWQRVPFETRDGSRFELALPVLSDAPMNSATLAKFEELAADWKVRLAKEVEG